jgi:hypothetical protein
VAARGGVFDDGACADALGVATDTVGTAVGPEFPDDAGFGIARIPPLGVIVMALGRGIAGIPPLGVIVMGFGRGIAGIPPLGVIPIGLGTAG